MGSDSTDGATIKKKRWTGSPSGASKSIPLTERATRTARSPMRAERACGTATPLPMAVLPRASRWPSRSRIAPGYRVTPAGTRAWTISSSAGGLRRDLRLGRKRVGRMNPSSAVAGFRAAAVAVVIGLTNHHFEHAQLPCPLGYLTGPISPMARLLFRKPGRAEGALRLDNEPHG